MDVKKYHIVEFPNERDARGTAAMDVVSSLWVVGEEGNVYYSYWPNFKSVRDIYRAAQEHMPVEKSWKKNLITMIYTSRDFDKISKKLKRLENATDVSQSEDEVQKRKVIVNRQYMDFDLEDYESDGPLPKPPCRKPDSRVKGVMANQPIDLGLDKENDPVNCELEMNNNDGASRHPQYTISVKQPLQHAKHSSAKQQPPPCVQCQINESLLIQMGVKIDLLASDLKYLIRISQNNAFPQDKDYLQPFEPCKTAEDLKKFNGQLQEPQKMNEMVSIFQTLGGKDASELIRRILGKLMTNEVSKGYNWCGRNSKEKFCELGNVIKLINLVLKKAPFGLCTEKEVDTVIKAWLRNASDREGGRQQRMKEKEQNASD